MMDTKEQGVPALGPAARARNFFVRFRDDRSGVAAVFFAIVLLLLIPLTLGLVNVYLSTSERSKLQDALDAASLYVARTNLTDATAINDLGTKILKANMGADKTRLHDVSFELKDSVVVARAQMTASSVVPSPFTGGSLGARSEVTRNGMNVEVAIVLDTTGSMANYMTGLKSAATELVTTVVKDGQTDQDNYYSKAALIPYAASVNVGSLADKVRGPLVQAVAISSAAPVVLNSKNYTTITMSDNHGFANGDVVYFSGLVMRKKTSSTSTKYTYAAGEYTVNTISGQPKKFNILLDTSSYPVYNSGGAVQCLAEGCQLFRFANAEGAFKRFYGRPCVTERIGAQAATDAPPSTALVGRNYAGTSETSEGSSNTACKSAEIVPLTKSPTKLTGAISKLNSYGFTAGQVGLAWGWYALAPKWGTDGVWTGESVPVAYDEPETLKVLVLMTDGAFNTGYCQGVIANNSTDSNNADQNACNATNGTPFTQASALCTAIKKEKIQIYTVGFNIGSDGTLKKFLEDCSTDKNTYYKNAANEQQLKDAFKAIGQDINKLRISR